jgi:hypothetical protein
VNDTGAETFGGYKTIEEKSVYRVELLSQFQEKLPYQKIATYVSSEGTGSALPSQTEDHRSTRALPFERSVVRPVLELPKARKVDRFNSLQKWEGIVLEVRKDLIIARLQDLGEIGIEEEAEIPMAEIETEDCELVRPGAIFYWNIGYLETAKSQRIRSSLIRFKRIPYITKKKMEGAALEADHLRQLIRWG